MIHHLNSSNVEKIEWHKDILIVFFLSGEIMKYEDVPEGIFEGIRAAASAGSYLNRYVSGVFFGKRIDKASVEQSELKKLVHHRDCTCGLWATDLPDKIPGNVREFFFEIKY